jgi:penicillin amidase
MAASAPGLPAAWYVAALRSERGAISGATWPGLPGVIVDQVITERPALAPAPQRVLLQHLLALPPAGWLQTRVHGMLRQWNYDFSSDKRLDNASAATYAVWVWHLARDAFQDELGAELFNHYWVTGFAPAALARLSAKPDDTWWDDVTTPQVEKRDDTMRRAFAEALEYLGRHYGDLHTIWEWDTLHAAQFRHSLGEVWPLAWLVNRTVKLGGDALFDPGQAGNSPTAYVPVLIPAVQINADQFALAGGQSGNPFSPHYADLLPLWQRGQTVPLQDAARPEDLKDVEGVLVLTP